MYVTSIASKDEMLRENIVNTTGFVIIEYTIIDEIVDAVAFVLTVWQPIKLGMLWSKYLTATLLRIFQKSAKRLSASLVALLSEHSVS